MPNRRIPLLVLLLPALLPNTPAHANEQSDALFEPMDVFALEVAANPEVTPDGERVIYTRQYMDIMKDRLLNDIWIVDIDGDNHQPLITGGTASSPRISPDGNRLLYTSSASGSPQLHVRWLDSGRDTPITRVREAPSNASWSPDGQWIAFTMAVPVKKEPLIRMPSAPKGAEWVEEAKYIDELIYRIDGRGYLENKYSQVFVVSAEGGTPRQLTDGEYNHGGRLAWGPDNRTLYFSANRQEDWRHDPVDSDLFAVDVASGEIKQLTERDGPDANPVISPDGRYLAYTGFDDEKLGYHVNRLYLLDLRSGESRMLTGELERDVQSPTWHDSGSGLYFLYDDEGNTRVAFVDTRGKVRNLADNAGGLSFGRPYGGAQLDVGDNTVAFTQAATDRPAELAVLKGGTVQRITQLNDDLVAQNDFGKVEEFRTESSADGRPIHAWIVTPPDFDPEKKYPLILEIHGGPFANYGPRFSAEVQLYAARGYVVVYVNPRGSTSYGAEFANLIHHNYPSEDYDDLMSAVDAVIERGYIDTDHLYVTGGSGGGVLTAWIVGKTDRFRAAVVAKPVINWTSFVLTGDFSSFFQQYWFGEYPWEDPDAYWKRSPLSLAGNVTTPTMVLTGEQDYRTPISESEQFYQALKLQKVDAALVRIADSSHSIAARPSNLIRKTEYILGWFEKYREKQAKDER